MVTFASYASTTTQRTMRVNAVPLAWAVFAYCAVAALFTAAFDLPAWFDDASPFAHIPKVPLQTVTAADMLVITVPTVALLVVGSVGFRRRDAGY
ncbi:hypothetical protein [Nocardia sputi]|uniref:hypothetical protein n=1 Tax=Nocardia sputi TaxID=2943705 RepID=UPI00189421C2|nr:hypothetical protein [Nocardia sputi]MBF6208268.1 hypothetical protein [Streptomyces gardneri]